MDNLERYNEMLKARYIYTRRSDGKVFRLTFLSHWSDIQSDDGETDSVKWYGNDSQGELYVSASKGHTYVKGIHDSI